MWHPHWAAGEKVFTSSARYIIGGFILAEPRVEQVRRSTERALALLGASNADASVVAARRVAANAEATAADADGGAAALAAAKAAMEHAAALNPRYAVTRQNLGEVIRRSRDDGKAILNTHSSMIRLWNCP